MYTQAPLGVAVAGPQSVAAPAAAYLHSGKGNKPVNQRAFNFLSIAVAGCALGLSVWQGYIQRVHNHVSVEPRINAYFQSNEGNHTHGLYLINNGMGPGYVESLDIYFDGKLVSGANQMEPWRFQTAMPGLGLANKACLVVAGPRPNDSMRVGEEIQLITLGTGSPLDCLLTKAALLNADWSRLDFVLKVKSIYGDRYSYRFKSNTQTKT